MNYYLQKYVGTYRVRAEIAFDTKDFLRDHDGNLIDDGDIWIQCQHDIRIYYYGKSILEVWIPSIKRGNNLLKTEQIQQVAFDIRKSDAEVVFKVKDKDLPNIIDLLHPITNGANISPFSPKNLPKDKSKVQFTTEQNEVYQKITAPIPKEDKLLIGKLNTRFLKEILAKKLKKERGLKDMAAIKADMKKEQLKLREYIYFRGYERDYIDFLQKEISKIYEQ